MSICISVPYCTGVKSDTFLTKAGRGEHFGGGTGEGAVWGRKVSNSSDEKPGKLFKSFFILFPSKIIQTDHVIYQHSSLICRWRIIERRAHFSLSLHVSHSHLLQGKMLLVRPGQLGGFGVQTSSQALGNMYQVFYQSPWPGGKIKLLNYINQLTSSFISH